MIAPFAVLDQAAVGGHRNQRDPVLFGLRVKVRVPDHLGR